jgi:hypothetical protein
VGGASMEDGKDLSVELVPVTPTRITRR